MKKTIFIMYTILLLTIMSMSYFAYGATSDSKIIDVSIINQDPDPAIAGDVVEVRLGISNSGGSDANNVRIEFVPSYPFSIVSGDPLVQDVGTIGAYQGSDDVQNIQIVKYRLMVDKDATNKDYDLQFKLSSDGLVNSITKTLTINVGGSTNAEIIHIDKTVIVPGQQSSLMFKINNVGNAPLKDLTFSWVNSAGVILPVGSDNTRYVKYIGVGESSEIEYQVIADTTATAGLYQLDLTLNYDNAVNSSSKKISTIAGVYVGGGTDFDVAFSDSTTGTTSFTIANTGSNPASSVSVVIPEQVNWKVSGTNSMIIGNLNKGDYTVASFKLQRATIGATNPTGEVPNPSMLRNNTNPRNFTRSNQSSNALTIQIVYTDTLGVRVTAEKTVQILSSQNSTGTFNGAAGPYGRPSNVQKGFFAKYKWYVIVVVLIAGGIIFWQYKKKRLVSDVKSKDDFKLKRK